MIVDALWQYPVKSMAGESVQRVTLDERGVQGDRLWAVHTPEGKLGSGKTTRRFQAMPGLLHLRASMGEDSPTIQLPNGAMSVADPQIDAALSEVLGQSVQVVPEGEVSHFDRGALHIVTTASLRWLSQRLEGDRLDVRRLRPNLVVSCDGAEQVEQDWIGREIAVGSVRLQVRWATGRCVMTSADQPGLPHDPRVLQAIADQPEANLGVYASVVLPGSIGVGDTVTVGSAPSPG